MDEKQYDSDEAAFNELVLFGGRVESPRDQLPEEDEQEQAERYQAELQRAVKRARLDEPDPVARVARPDMIQEMDDNAGAADNVPVAPEFAEQVQPAAAALEMPPVSMIYEIPEDQRMRLDTDDIDHSTFCLLCTHADRTSSLAAGDPGIHNVRKTIEMYYGKCDLGLLVDTLYDYYNQTLRPLFPDHPIHHYDWTKPSISYHIANVEVVRSEVLSVRDQVLSLTRMMRQIERSGVYVEIRNKSLEQPELHAVDKQGVRLWLECSKQHGVLQSRLRTLDTSGFGVGDPRVQGKSTSSRRAMNV